MRHTLVLVMVGGCRLYFDPVSQTSDAITGDGSGPGHVNLEIHGAGAVTGPEIACADACGYDLPGPVTLTSVPGEAWELTAWDVPGCGANATCTVATGTHVTATFARAPRTANLAFVSSMITGVGPTGRAAYDTLCQGLAGGIGIPGTFIALVGISTQAATDRLLGSRGWVRMDGLPIIDQPTDFATATPRGILFDESGVAHEDPVMTGAFPDGGIGVSNCGNWTSTTSGLGGLADSTNAWLLSQSTTLCTGRVYCFEIGKTHPVELVPAPFPVGRYVFTSTNAFTPGGGIAAADAQCQADAIAATLPGTYKALLPTSNESAATHLGSSLAGVWRRPDGIVVTRTGLDQMPYDAGLMVTANGAASFNLAWGTSLATVGGLTCNDWTSSTQNGAGAWLQMFRQFPFDQVLQNSCNTTNHVICAQR